MNEQELIEIYKTPEKALAAACLEVRRLKKIIDNQAYQIRKKDQIIKDKKYPSDSLRQKLKEVEESARKQVAEYKAKAADAEKKVEPLKRSVDLLTAENSRYKRKLQRQENKK